MMIMSQNMAQKEKKVKNGKQSQTKIAKRKSGRKMEVVKIVTLLHQQKKILLILIMHQPKKAGVRKKKKNHHRRQPAVQRLTQVSIYIYIYMFIHIMYGLCCNI